LKDAAAQQPPPPIPYSSIPPIVTGSTVKPLPSTTAKSTRRAASISTAPKNTVPGLHGDLLDALKALKPSTAEAQDVFDDIHNGEHGIWKLNHREQLSLLYEAFQHHWCELLRECHQHFLSNLIGLEPEYNYYESCRAISERQINWEITPVYC
jgi:hypothetical protein